MERVNKTVPEQIGKLAAGLAKVIADMDREKEKKDGKNQKNVMKKKEKSQIS